MPAVIFKNGFRYNWHIADSTGKGDFLDYITRPNAFVPENHKSKNDEFYDFFEYMRNSEKSDGAFDFENNHLEKKELDKYREYERVSRSEGCPKFSGVMSFDNNFLRKNGLLIGKKNLDTTRLKEISRKGINALISKSKKLQNDNVYWVAAIHTSTDNVHVHYSFCEYHRLRDRKLTDKRNRQDCLELNSFEALKSTVANSIISEKRTPELTALKRQIIFPELSECVGSSEKLIFDLYKKLPNDISLQYGNHKMKAFHKEIENCIDNIIHSNAQLQSDYDKYILSLYEMNSQYRELYGDNSNASLYSEHQIDDFYNRAGNILLKHIKKMRNEADEEKRVEKTGLSSIFENYAVSERNKKINDSYSEVIRYIERNDKYISEYRTASILKKIIFDYEPDKKAKNIKLLEKVAEQNDTAAMTLGLIYDFEKKFEKAECYYKISANNNNADSQYRLGKMYLREEKNDYALEYLRRSADNDNSSAQFSYGMILNKLNMKSEGYYYINSSAQNGNKIAENVAKNLVRQHKKATGKNKGFCKGPQVRKAVQRTQAISSACWYTLKQLIQEYESHIKMLQAEFDYENNISNDEVFDYSYD